MQVGTIGEYHEKFEMLSSRLRKISEEALKSNFMKGLKPEIRAAIRPLVPRGIADAMKLAQMVEDEKKIERSNRGGVNTFHRAAPYGGTSRFLPTAGKKRR